MPPPAHAAAPSAATAFPAAQTSIYSYSVQQQPQQAHPPAQPPPMPQPIPMAMMPPPSAPSAAHTQISGENKRMKQNGNRMK